MKLEQRIDELESHIANAAVGNNRVSRQAVGWHIHHSLKVIHSILDTLAKSDPNGYKWEFNFNRAVFLTTLGWFPRGTAKAPRLVRPPENVDLDLIREELEAVRSKQGRLDILPAGTHFKHPYFGVLNMASARRFLDVHTHHHLKIIRDILKSTG